ncbi:MAG: MFS transporter [Longicatena sp.]
MLEKTKYLYYALNFLVFFILSFISTQMIPYLIFVGYSIIERGYIIAGSAIVVIAGQFIFGFLSDRFKRMKLFFIIAYALFLLGSFGMYGVQHQVFYYHMFVVSLMSGMVKVMIALDETWMLALRPKQYGSLRATGALGFSLGAPVAGFCITSASYNSLLYVTFFLSIVVLIIVCATKDSKPNKSSKLELKDIHIFIKNKRYVALVFIFFLVYMIGSADQYIVIDKMVAIGASSNDIAFKWALQSFMEVPLFFLANRLLNRWKARSLLLFATFMYTLKFILYAFSTTPTMIVLSASLQLVTLPIVMLTSKVLIQEVSLKRMYTSAQMFAMAIFIGLSGCITPILTSYLSKVIGYNQTLYAIAAFTIVPILCIIHDCKVVKKSTS